MAIKSPLTNPKSKSTASVKKEPKTEKGVARAVEEIVVAEVEVAGVANQEVVAMMRPLLSTSNKKPIEVNSTTSARVDHKVLAVAERVQLVSFLVKKQNTIGLKDNTKEETSSESVAQTIAQDSLVLNKMVVNAVAEETLETEEGDVVATSKAETVMVATSKVETVMVTTEVVSAAVVAAPVRAAEAPHVVEARVLHNNERYAFSKRQAPLESIY